jgi:hypothetical protein
MSTRQSLPLFSRSLMLALALVPAQSLLAQVEPIMSPAKRAEALEEARSLLAPKPIPASQANPFFSETFNDVRTGGAATSGGAPETATAAVAGPAGPKSGRDLLQAIAGSLKPSGYFVLGGTPTLVFGQKRVKAGGLLTVTYEGKEYTLEVTSLDRTNFTLRLNREEFTRPIK